MSHGVVAQVNCSAFLNDTASRSCSENKTAPGLDANRFALSAPEHYSDVITSYSQISRDVIITIKKEHNKTEE